MPHPWRCSRLGCMWPWADRADAWSGGWQPCPWQGGWNLLVFEVPSNANHSVILWWGCGDALQPEFIALCSSVLQWVLLGNILLTRYNCFPPVPFTQHDSYVTNTCTHKPRYAIRAWKIHWTGHLASETFRLREDEKCTCYQDDKSLKYLLSSW